MDEHQSGLQHVQSSSAPHFVAQAPSHVPPATLSDGDLAVVIDSLYRKRRSARHSLLLARIAGATLTLIVIGAGFAVLWAGPAPFFARFLGHDYVTTTFDAAAWWLVLLLLAILGGTFGDQLLRGKLRIVRGWQHRVHDLERRLADAEDVRRQRASA
jgi:hypothetical protein